MASVKVINEACDLENLSVRELKVFLRDRGAHVSGTRPELLKRAKGVVKLGLRRLCDVNKENNETDKQRDLEKFTSPLGEQLPEPWKLVDWDSDVCNIPFMRTTDLYNYLVLNRNRTFDSDSMKAKRQLKAKVFYEDKHVHSMMYHPVKKDLSHCYVKCKVIPSLPTGTLKQKPDYDVWVCLSKVTGNVHSAGCTCSAGEGESCNHVAALLYALVDISSKTKDGLLSPTSLKCTWNQPRKRKLSPKKSQNLTFKKHKFDDKSATTATHSSATKGVKKRLDKLENIQPVNIDKFCAKLRSCAPHAAFLLCKSEDNIQSDFLPDSNGIPVPDTDHVPDLHDVKFLYNDNVNLKSEDCIEHFTQYFDSLNCSEADCDIIAESTKGQSQNDLWVKSRHGRITSSNFGRICKLKESTPPESTVKTVMGYECFTAKSTDWGKNHETAARRVYAKTIQKTHPNLKVFNCGLMVNTRYPHLGSTPDALLNCNHCLQHEGVLEIKCPYSARFLSPEEAGLDKTFFCEIVENKLRLKRNHTYYFQVQGQMAITNRKWCDFFVWTLKGHSVERIYFDETFWRAMEVKLSTFYKSAIIPELWSRRVKRGQSLFD